MTKQEVIDYITTQLATPVTLVSKVINSFLKVLDFASQSAVDDVIPDWDAAITFQLDGTDGGKYCLHADTDGKKRIFETKIAANLNNEPPTDPAVTENASWVEISQSAGSGISEWEAGIYGSGLVIVYHNHSTEGPALYKLNEASRPFASSDIEAEIIAGSWTLLTINDAQVNTVIHTNAETTGTVGTGEDVLYSYTLPANTLQNTNEAVVFTACGDFAANANNKTLSVKLGSAVLFSTGPLAISTNASWVLEGEIIRTSTGIAKFNVRLTTSSSVIPGSAYASFTLEDLSTALDLAITGEGTTNNDVRGGSFRVRFEPAGLT